MSEQGWIEWRGGDCPVEAHAIVDARKRNGDTAYGFRADHRPTIGCWDRAWRSRRTDIIAYRLAHPTPGDSPCK